MITRKRTAKRYLKENGEDPFGSWLDNLDLKLEVKVELKIEKLELGNISGCSILKGSGGVREARIKTYSGIRIYFAEIGDRIFKRL